MEHAKPMLRRCAIYTRKSSEEGLEQNFNSLHAQREACEAFIKSQASEGWRLVKTHYDDGGISGASMERPALQCCICMARGSPEAALLASCLSIASPLVICLRCPF
jgi:DNA invertase Pin-like site-specific DNA recombinase